MFCMSPRSGFQKTSFVRASHHHHDAHLSTCSCCTLLLIRHATNCCYQYSNSSRVRATCSLAYNFFGRARTLLVLCIYTEEKPERRKEKNIPTTPTAAELAPPHYGRYHALLTFLELLLWASSEVTTATDGYPNGRASSVSLLRVAAAL